jgi:hypothetical protein
MPIPSPLSKIVYLNGWAMAEGLNFDLSGSRIKFPHPLKVRDTIIVPFVIDSKVQGFTKVLDAEVPAGEWVDLWGESSPSVSRFDLIG